MYGALVTLSLRKSMHRQNEKAGKELMVYMARMEKERLFQEALELCSIEEWKRFMDMKQ